MANFPEQFDDYLYAAGFGLNADGFSRPGQRIYLDENNRVFFYTVLPDGTQIHRASFYFGLDFIDLFGWMLLLHLLGFVTLQEVRRKAREEERLHNYEDVLKLVSSLISEPKPLASCPPF